MRLAQGAGFHDFGDLGGQCLDATEVEGLVAAVADSVDVGFADPPGGVGLLYAGRVAWRFAAAGRCKALGGGDRGEHAGGPGAQFPGGAGVFRGGGSHRGLANRRQAIHSLRIHMAQWELVPAPHHATPWGLTPLATDRVQSLLDPRHPNQRLTVG